MPRCARWATWARCAWGAKRRCGRWAPIIPSVGPCKAWTRDLAQAAGLPLPQAVVFASLEGLASTASLDLVCCPWIPAHCPLCPILLLPCPGAALVAVYGFAVAAMWIALFATEIVGLLQFFGMLRCAVHAVHAAVVHTCADALGGCFVC